MGLITRMFGRGGNPQSAAPRWEPKDPICAAAKNDGSEIFQTFNDRNITFSGDLVNYDYGSILRNKQRNIIKLYE